MLEFRTSDGEIIVGTLVKQYRCFEGYTRYIFEDINGRQYRCVCTEEGEYKEELI